jgi:ribosomal-protein-alanine N-acetyltransferase
LSFTYRKGVADDLELVFRLNKGSFAESWSNDGLKTALQEGYDLLLCMDKELLAGYLLSRNVLEEVHIMQIAVASSHRRRGVAEQLSRRLLDANPGKKFLLEVRISNIAAQALYAKLGFTHSGVRRAYYVSQQDDGIREDAILMQYQCQ